MLKVINFLKSVLYELQHKVSWPTQDELQRAMIFFLIGILVCSVFVGFANFFLKKLIDSIYSKF